MFIVEDWYYKEKKENIDKLGEVLFPSPKRNLSIYWYRLRWYVDCLEEDILDIFRERKLKKTLRRLKRKLSKLFIRIWKN